MSSKILRFELNESGVRELLQSKAMQSILRDKAEEKARLAGSGYESDVHLGKNRAYANVYPATKEARQDNFDNNTLEKVIRS